MRSARLTALSAAAALAFGALVPGLPAPAQAREVPPDMTTEKRIICTVVKGARCKDGKCRWEDPPKRDQATQLVVHFDDRKAYVARGPKRRPIGVVLRDEVKDGSRHVTIARDAKADPQRHLMFTMDKKGSMKGSRLGGRVRFETRCEPDVQRKS